MEKYQIPADELKYLEELPTPLVVYQFVDGHVFVLALSEGYRKMFGMPDRAEAYRLLNQDVLLNTHPDDAERLKDSIHRFITEDAPYDVIFRGKQYQGITDHIIHGVGKHVFREDGVRLAYVAFTDEGEYTGEEDMKAATLSSAFNKALYEESVLRAVYYDRLTGLPGMTHFIELAENGKDAILAEGKCAALLYIDLFGMKNFNDNYGFAEGDRILRAFAGLLKDTFGGYRSCHISADRFAAFAAEEEVKEKLPELFQKAKDLNNGRTLPIRAGIYLTSIEDVAVITAFDRAKIACDALPKTDNSAYLYYSTSMREFVKQRQYILSHFDQALREGWIQVYYQPIIRAVTGRVCDEEALARWIDPVKGFMSPAEFIPILEDAGVIYRLDLYMLERMLEKMKEQSARGLYVVPNSVNLSRADFDACDIVEEIRRRVDASGIGRDKVTIEITESIIGSDFEFMKEQVERFQALGFPVWMDDFGSGYSSLDVLQSIKFNLLKFDMGFLRKLDEGEEAKIILSELMKMATSLGLDTICEGVETEEQVHFLQDIGCSKLQGYYFCKPIPYDEILERNRKGIQIGFENPDESSYYEAIGRVNLYDLGVIASEDAKNLQNAMSMLPMGIIEFQGELVRLVRSNLAYRNFARNYLHIDFPVEGSEFSAFDDSFMRNIVKTCCEQGGRAFYDDKMPDGTVVHSFARKIGTNKVTGRIAVAIAVLSISAPSEVESYADIARALASDYYNIFVVDLETNQFMEYFFPAGATEMVMERHGDDFFETAEKEARKRVYGEDRTAFFEVFSREKILEALDRQGVFTTSTRVLDDNGTPVYVGMKVTRLDSRGSRIIIGTSIIDAQMKQKQAVEREHRQNVVFGRIAALSGEYYAMYLIDPETGVYSECNVTEEYRKLGFDKSGEDFFLKSRADAQKVACPEDLPMFLEQFTREKVMRDIAKKGRFQIRYRIMVNGKPLPVRLRAARVKESDGEKIVVGLAVGD